MNNYPIFLSIVIPLKNFSGDLQSLLMKYGEVISSLVLDYEIIIIDNASDDGILQLLGELLHLRSYSNIQVYSLIKEVDFDEASWIGVENSLGDYVAVINPLTDDINFLQQMLERVVQGVDIVFANNKTGNSQSMPYKVAFNFFNILYKKINKIDLKNESAQYRILSKAVINFILRHPQPSLIYRYLPVSGGFSRDHLIYTSSIKGGQKRQLIDGINRGMQLLVSTTKAPMRIVTALSLFGAFANFLYCIYVVSVGALKSDVAPGWVSLSLQQSGMFFLISVVLLVLGEYILQMASLTNEGPSYHIGQELKSSYITRYERLNIEEAPNSAAYKQKIEDRGIK